MQEFLNGAAAIISYLLPAVIAVFIARKPLKLPDELFRKILHLILMAAYVPILFVYQKWQHAAGFAVLLCLVLYPVFALSGRIPAFSSFVNERKKGEYKNSTVLALCVMLLSILIGWGWLGDRYLVLAGIYAWGIGDAFAALLGKQFGRHKIHWKYADSHKSMEGSAAMLLTSALSVFIVLHARGGLGIADCLMISIAAALVSTVVELCSKNGFDTVTCPAAAMAVIIPLVKLLSA